MELTLLNTIMKMGQRESIKWHLFIFLSLIALPSFGLSDLKKETHKRLMSVNTNWVDLEQAIKHTFVPNSEQELIQLHLLNVVSYLEDQTTTNLNKEQKENRQLNISLLRQYCLAGDFPINTVTAYRTPIFIDAKHTHCAVGYLLKENELEKVAQEIAKKQLLYYLEDIKHPQLSAWQKSCGLSLFELALIQPTYGPPIPVCAAPSPIQWHPVKTDSRITQLFQSNDATSIYGISPLDELGLQQEVKRYSSSTHLWTSVGSQINGEILDLTFCNNQIFISVLLPDKDYPHQLLKLKQNKWEKVAHFDGSIMSMQALQNKLYVMGNFKKVNESIASNMVVIDNDSIKLFKPFGLKNMPFDHMKSSELALFLTSHGAVFKFKNDTIKHLTNIQYYSYINDISLDAIKDSLFVSSLSIQGYNTYFDNREHPTYMSNMLFGQDYPYRTVSFTKSKKINGNMLIAGDFKSSTLMSQMNDERVLIHCADSISSHWYGEGLLYQYGRLFYPILKEGIVLDFVQLNNQIFVLKKDGSISYASLALIKEKIHELRERGLK